jgi:hypothetical protein
MSGYAAFLSAAFSLVPLTFVNTYMAEIRERRALRPPDSPTAGINPAARCRILHGDSVRYPKETEATSCGIPSWGGYFPSAMSSRHVDFLDCCRGARPHCKLLLTKPSDLSTLVNVSSRHLRIALALTRIATPWAIRYSDNSADAGSRHFTAREPDFTRRHANCRPFSGL